MAFKNIATCGFFGTPVNLKTISSVGYFMATSIAVLDWTTEFILLESKPKVLKNK